MLLESEDGGTTLVHVVWDRVEIRGSYRILIGELEKETTNKTKTYSKVLC